MQITIYEMGLMSKVARGLRRGEGREEIFIRQGMGAKMDGWGLNIDNAVRYCRIRYIDTRIKRKISYIRNLVHEY
jgi:hypothetical protein